MRTLQNNNQLPTSEKQHQEIEKMLDAANSASQTVAALHVAFLAFVAYLGVIVWGTTHEDLLRISPVKLPILDVELPLTAFYNFVPWMVVLLHFNLLMQLELLSCKLWNLDSYLPDNEEGRKVRDRLFIFPFTHLIIGRSSVALIRWLLGIIVGITIIALPLFMLLAAQIRFLPFHDEAITWSQRLSIWVDAGMLLALWPLTASPSDKAHEWWQGAYHQLFSNWPKQLGFFTKNLWHRLLVAFRPKNEDYNKDLLFTKSHPPLGIDPKGMIALLVSLPLVVVLSVIAVIPGSITVHTYFNPKQAEARLNAADSVPSYFEDWLIRKAPVSWLSVASYQYDDVSCSSLPKAEDSDAEIQQVMFGPCAWFNWGLFPRNLDLKEARLVPKEVTLSLLTRATDPEKLIRDTALKEFDGLNLQNRDLRFANMFGAVLPKADLRHVQLQGAILLQAKLQGIIGWDRTLLQSAILGGTQLQGAGLTVADLRDADLRGANLQSADLQGANLQSADLRGADLKAANLQKANLQGADLRGAHLQGSILKETLFQGANLAHANFQGSDLTKANLQGALLIGAQFQGTDKVEANFDGAFINLSSTDNVMNNQQKNALITTLKPLLDAEKFTVLEQRLNSSETQLESAVAIDCFGNQPALLPCLYHDLGQIGTYRSQALFPKLIALACSDTAIAIGITRRAIEALDEPNFPDFGLTEALVIAHHQTNPCPGLAGLSVQTQQKLSKKSEQQKLSLSKQ